jgi:hypothetical protein
MEHEGGAFKINQAKRPASISKNSLVAAANLDSRCAMPNK